MNICLENIHFKHKEITVNVVQYDGMSLSKTAGSNILSYADEQKTPGSQTCTVTAQLKNGSAAASVSGVPIVFGVYKNDVLVGTTSSVNTDSNGQASYTYTVLNICLENIHFKRHLTLI